jgi:hypothetical protein
VSRRLALWSRFPRVEGLASEQLAEPYSTSQSDESHDGLWIAAATGPSRDEYTDTLIRSLVPEAPNPPHRAPSNCKGFGQALAVIIGCLPFLAPDNAVNECYLSKMKLPVRSR